MTERDQCAFEEALRLDLNAVRQQVMLLTDQLREANSLNEALSYKVDFLTQEVGRVTTSREQYERVSIRVATIAESVANIAIKQLQDLQEEIKAAAFAKVPGAVTATAVVPPGVATASGVDYQKPARGTMVVGNPTSPDTVLEQIGQNFGAGFGESASLLPPARFGNGATKAT